MSTPVPRVYEVIEVTRVVSVGHVRARSKAEAVRMVEQGLVTLYHEDSEPAGSITARLLHGEEARYNDPGDGAV